MDALHLDLIPHHSQTVVGQLLTDEAVLVLPEAGKVQVLNEVGARIWALIDGLRTLRQIAAVISAEYQVEPSQAEQDVLDFVGSLAQRGAVKL